MFPRLTLFLALALTAFMLSAQNYKVTVDRNIQDVRGAKSAVFSATNASPAHQTIILELTGGSYLRANSSLPVITTIGPGRTNLITLTEVNGAPGYTYKYVEGCLGTKPKEVVYLLPVAPGKQTRIDTLSNVNTLYFGRQHPENWLAFSMTAEPGDTIFASRRGMVTKVESEQVSEIKSGLTYSSYRTHLIVEHEDCTRANYELFEKEGIMVAEGQYVEAGEPLGLVQDGKAYVSGAHLRFMVYYPDLTRDVLKGIMKSNGFPYAFKYISPLFLGVGIPESGKTYTSEHPEDIITQEMSKREIKRWKKEKSER